MVRWKVDGEDETPNGSLLLVQVPMCIHDKILCGFFIQQQLLIYILCV